MLSPRCFRHAVVLVAPLAMAPGVVSAQTTLRVFCYSDYSGQGSVVYMTQIFDTGLSTRVEGGVSTQPIANEYLEYLKGRADYKGSSNYPTGCSPETARAQIKAQAEQGGKQVVELEWNYGHDPATAGVGPQGKPTDSKDYGWCFSPGTSGTVYAAGPFQVKGRVAEYDWNRAFGKFLADKYGLKAEASCAVGTTLAWAERRVKIHVQGARDGNRKVVETGWDWGSPAPSSAPAVKPDDDPEPAAPPPPPPPPSASARDFATKEVPEVMALCNNDKLISGAFDCSMVSRVVYNYRLANWSATATPEPLAQLFAGDKLDCTTCIKQFAEAWAVSRAQSTGYVLPPAPAQCVGTRFVEGIKAKPYPNRVKEVFDAAVAACKR
jgi:hypothetical protein